VEPVFREASLIGSARLETNAVAIVVEALALSRPEAGFFLKADGRGLLALPAAADLRERVAQVHGLSLARSLVPLDEVVGGPVWGLVSPLFVSFPTRRYLHVAVNGRVVDTDSFAPAVAKAYADLLPKGRHPAAFLPLDLGPGEVDVNVHPAKSAVRLRGGRSAYPLVAGAIRSALTPERAEGEEGAGAGGRQRAQADRAVRGAVHNQVAVVERKSGVYKLSLTRFGRRAFDAIPNSGGGFRPDREPGL
jgi:DNA mismatch repair protein MutL